MAEEANRIIDEKFYKRPKKSFLTLTFIFVALLCTLVFVIYLLRYII